MTSAAARQFTPAFTQLHHLDIFDVVSQYRYLYQRLYANEGRSFGFEGADFSSKGSHSVYSGLFERGETRAVFPAEHRAHSYFTEQFRQVVRDLSDLADSVRSGTMWRQTTPIS